MSKLTVEDHGNGFMVIGTLLVRPARKILKKFVDKPKQYKFAAPTYYEDSPAVWFSTVPGAHWDGALDHTRKPMKR